MSWLGKIFRGSRHDTLGGHRRGEDYDPHAPSTSGKPWLKQENKDTSCSLAPSHLEESQNRKDAIANETQLKEDEQLAGALRDSLKVESPPRSGNGNAYQKNVYQPRSIHFPKGYRVCARCYSEIGNGRILICLDAFWHPECFRCYACNLPISDYEFAMNGIYTYHCSCYEEWLQPKCDICEHFIPKNPAGLFDCKILPIWNQKYCLSHEHDGTPQCCSCWRMEAKKKAQNTGYVKLDNGRKLCSECLDSAILNDNDCQALYFSIQKFYEQLNMKLEEAVPIFLVDKQTLDEGARSGEKHDNNMQDAVGLCLCELHTESIIIRQPSFGANNRVMDMITQPYMLTRRYKINGILVLYGFPRLVTGTIIAHEIMHAWIRLKGFPALSQFVEEGICQVLSYKWLESELESASDNNVVSSSTSKKVTMSQFERELGELLKYHIGENSCPVYGGGLRAGMQAIRKYGLN